MNIKIKNIELLRIIGITAIVLLHLFQKRYLYSSFHDISLYSDILYKMTRDGSKAVELFFILSGFFFSYKININTTLWSFFKNKIVRLYPVLTVIIALTFVLSLFNILDWSFYKYLFCFLGINNTALVYKPFTTTVSPFWYCSNLIYVLLLYFYLLKNYQKKSVNLFIAIAIIFSYSIIIQGHKGKISVPNFMFYNIISMGTLRAIGGIGIGYFIGEWYKQNKEKIKAFIPNIYQKIIISIAECSLILFIISGLFLRRQNINNDMIFVIAFISIIILFLSNKGFISKFFDRDIFVKIAKYTYSIFISHMFVLDVLKNTFWKHNSGFIHAHPIINIIITLIIIIILGILLYHFVEKPCLEYYKKHKT